MIDTIGIQFSHVKISWNIYSAWADEKHHRPNSKFTISQYGFTEELENGSSIRYTYLPGLQKGLLKLEFSLPNLLYGNNVQLIYDINEAVDAANSLLPEIEGIPRVDLWNGILYRLDVCYNFQSGWFVPWYISALKPLEYPYRRTRPYTTQGVQYENTQAILRFYNKARERWDLGDPTGALLASGIFRMEAELKRKYLVKLTKSKRPTLRLISMEWIYDVLENELKQLDLLGNSIGTVDTTLKVLREKYGIWGGLALLGLIYSKSTYPTAEMLAEELKLHPNSIGRHIQTKLVENGIPPTLTEYREPLPPLTIDRGSGEPGGGILKLGSVIVNV